MTGILLLVAALTGAACLVATVLGHAPVGDLGDFHADDSARVRHFDADPASVLAAYVEAAHHTPGMRVVDRAGSQLLIDLRPTARILDGNFGMALRITATGSDTGSEVRLDAQHKVAWACWNHDAALRSAEMSLRARAKRHGVVEVI